VLYVGRARDLRARLRSYFRSERQRPQVEAALAALERGDADAAFYALMGIDDEQRRAAFDAIRQSASATFSEFVAALGPAFEGGYFLYRFSDPTFLVAGAVVSTVGQVVLDRGSAAIDVCGGSGHLTRVLAAFTPRPLLADFYFSKLWLAKRFTAPSCQPVCCDANAPLPFDSGAFRLVVCSDAFHYIWTKRLLATEMIRVASPGGAVALTHVHSALQWNPSAGMTLPPAAYEQLFADASPRLYSERLLLDDVITHGSVHLERRHPAPAIESDPALTLVASSNAAVFSAHAIRDVAVEGELRLNPLYAVESSGDDATLVLRFPSADYEDEYAATREYLPDRVTLPRSLVDRIQRGDRPREIADLLKRRIVLDLPHRYV